MQKNIIGKYQRNRRKKEVGETLNSFPSSKSELSGHKCMRLQSGGVSSSVSISYSTETVGVYALLEAARQMKREHSRRLLAAPDTKYYKASQHLP